MGGGLVVSLTVGAFELWWDPLALWLAAKLHLTAWLLPKLAATALCFFIAGAILWFFEGRRGSILDDGFGSVCVASGAFLLILWLYKLAYAALGLSVPLMTQQIFGWLGFLFSRS
jgi:hypothetical protein